MQRGDSLGAGFRKVRSWSPFCYNSHLTDMEQITRKGLSIIRLSYSNENIADGATGKDRALRLPSLPISASASQASPFPTTP